MRLFVADVQLSSLLFTELDVATFGILSSALLREDAGISKYDVDQFVVLVFALDSTDGYPNTFLVESITGDSLFDLEDKRLSTAYQHTLEEAAAFLLGQQQELKFDVALFKTVHLIIHSRFLLRFIVLS